MNMGLCFLTTCHRRKNASCTDDPEVAILAYTCTIENRLLARFYMAGFGEGTTASHLPLLVQNRSLCPCLPFIHLTHVPCSSHISCTSLPVCVCVCMCVCLYLQPVARRARGPGSSVFKPQAKDKRFPAPWGPVGIFIFSKLKVNFQNE